MFFYMMESDGVLRCYQTHGLRAFVFGPKIKDGKIMIKGRMYLVNPRRFFRRAYYPRFPYFGFVERQHWASEYRWESPEAIDKHSAMPELPSPVNPKSIGSMLESWVFSKLHRKGLDIILIAFLSSIMVNVVLALSLAMRR